MSWREGGTVLLRCVDGAEGKRNRVGEPAKREKKMRGGETDRKLIKGGGERNPLIRGKRKLRTGTTGQVSGPGSGGGRVLPGTTSV